MFSKHTWHFSSRSGPDSGGRARNRPVGEGRADAAAGDARSRRDSAAGTAGPHPKGKPVVSPPKEGGQTQRDPPAPLPFPSLPPGVYLGPVGPGPCAAGTGVAGWGTLVTVAPPRVALPIPSSSSPSAGQGADTLVSPGHSQGHAAAGWKFRLRAWLSTAILDRKGKNRTKPRFVGSPLQRDARRS